MTPEGAYRGDITRHAEAVDRYRAEVVPLRQAKQPDRRTSDRSIECFEMEIDKTDPAFTRRLEDVNPSFITLVSEIMALKLVVAALIEQLPKQQRTSLCMTLESMIKASDTLNGQLLAFSASEGSHVPAGTDDRSDYPNGFRAE